MNTKRVAKELIDLVYLNRQNLDRCVELTLAAPEKVNSKHLIWMMNEIVRGNLHDITKENRWIGYVQGCLVALGLSNVDDMRDINKRPEGECSHTVVIHI